MTVSRVVTGVGSVHERTRRKVLAAIADLNYVPNEGARSLVGAAPVKVGFLYSNPSAAYLNEFLVGLLAQSGPSNAQLFLEKSQGGEDLQQSVQRLLNKALDSIILAPPLGDNAALIDTIARANVPIIAIACGNPDSRVSAVCIDDRVAATQITNHLLALGHQRIGFIHGPSNHSSSGRRFDGFRAAMEAAGKSIEDELIASGMFTYRSGLDAAEYLLSISERPTAIFASNDDMAAACVAVAHRLGLDVPGDLTVVGFDDTPLATTIWPELTTVHQPISDMAREAVRSVVRNVQRVRDGHDCVPERQVLDFQLIRRHSDAPPRKRPLGSGFI